jgi:hypothetical protein
MAVIYAGVESWEVWPLVRDHHYSRRMPSNIQHCYAALDEGGLFGDRGDVLAAIVFSFPPTRWAEDVLELSRLVRTPSFDKPLSQLISFAVARLRRNKVPLVVSFADQTQKHHGGVYQAAGWHYDSQRGRRMDGLIVNGTFIPGRSCNSRWGTSSPSRLQEKLPAAKIEPHFDDGKHLYWTTPTIAGRSKAKRLGLQSNPYPKPSAVCPLDECVPTHVSDVRPVETAPPFAREVAPA